MAIPTLPGYTGYTIDPDGIMEHPYGYVGLYRADASFQVSTPHYWRYAMFDKDTLAEMWTHVWQYNNPNDAAGERWNSPSGFVSAFDEGVIWTYHATSGIISLSIAPSGQPTTIQYHKRLGGSGGWIPDLVESPNHIWMTFYLNYVAAFTKVSRGKFTVDGSNNINGTLGAFYNTSNTNMYTLGYDPDTESVLVQTEPSISPKEMRNYHSTNFALRQTIVPLSTETFVRSNDENNRIDRFYETRNGNTYHREILSTGFAAYEDYLTWDPTANTLDQIIFEDGGTAGGSIVAWWDLNEASGTLRDRSGNLDDLTAHGTLAYGATGLIPSEGASGKAINCNSTGGGLTGSGATDLDTLAGYTFEAWVKINDTNPTTYRTILANGLSTDAYQSIMYDNTGGINTFRFLIYNGANEYATWHGNCVAGEIYHVVGTFSTTNGMRLYVNGYLGGTNSNTTHAGVANNYYFVGYNPTHTTYFNGQIGKAIIYSRELTAAEVLEHYTHGNQIDLTGTYQEHILSLNPIGYWPMDDVGTNHCRDVSGNGNSLIPVNNVSFNQPGYVEGGTGIATDGTTDTCVKTVNRMPTTSYTAISLEAWIYFVPGHTDNHVVMRFDDILLSNGMIFQLAISYSSNRTWSQYYLNAGADGAVEEVWHPPAEGVWKHFVITLDTGNNRQRMYIDGMFVGTDTAANYPLGTLDAWLGFGDTVQTFQSFPTNARYQHGAVYGFEMSEAQVLANYKKGKPTTPEALNRYEELILENEPVLYYPLDDLTGTQVTDKMDRSHGVCTGNDAANLTFGPGLVGDGSQPCFDFNGSEYVEMIDCIPVGSWSQLTVEAIAHDDVADSTNNDIVQCAESGGWLMRIDAQNDPSFILQSKASHPSYLTTEDTVHNPGTSRKFHLMATWDGRTQKLYHDGRLVQTQDHGSFTQLDYEAFVRMTIAVTHDAGAINGAYWNGRIAHVATYNKELAQDDAKMHWRMANNYDWENFPDGSVKKLIVDSDPMFFYPLDMEHNTSTERTVCDIMCKSPTASKGTFQTANVIPNIRSDTLLKDGYDTHMRSFYRTYSEYITINGITDHSAFNTNYSVPFCVEVFFKTAFVPGANSQHQIFSMHTSSATNRYRLGTGTTGQIMISVSGAGGDVVYGSGYNDDKLHHLVVTYNGLSSTAGVVAVWVDGVKLGSYNGHFPYSDITLASIGQEYDSGPTPGDFFSGRMSNLAIYHTMLSDAEIRSHWAAGFGADLTSSDDYADIIIADAPLAYYRLGEKDGYESMFDRMDNHHGTATDVVWEQTGAIAPSGSEDTAAYFDGVSSETYVNDLIIANSDDFTVEGWFKVNTGGRFELRRGRDGQGAGWSIVVQYDFDTQAYLFAVVTTSGGNAQYAMTPSVSVVADTWYHFAAMWEGGVGITLYHDGLPVGQTLTTTTTLRDSTFGWTFGINSDGTVYHENYMDEVAIYDRLLTPAEIIEHYITGKNIQDTYTGMVLADGPGLWWNWDSDDQSADNIFRERIQGYNGLFGNGATDSTNNLRIGSTQSARFQDYLTQPYCETDTSVQIPTMFSEVFTIEIWFQWDLTAYGTGERIIFQDGGLGKSCAIAFENAEFGIWIRAYGGTPGTLIKCVVPSWSIPFNVPVHVVAVFNNALSLYINGRLVQTTPGPVTDFAGTAGTTIGALNSLLQSSTRGAVQTNRNSMQGYVDDVIVYGAVMSAARVLQHYDAGWRDNGYERAVWHHNPDLYLKMDDQLVGGYALETKRLAQFTNGNGSTTSDCVDEVDGYVDRCYYFDGETNNYADGVSYGHYIRASGAQTAYLDMINGFTACCWIKPYPKTSTYGHNGIMNTYDNGGPSRFYWNLEYNTAQQACRPWTRIDWGSGSTTTTFTTGPNDDHWVPVGEWSFVTFVLERSGSDAIIKLYVNGNLLTLDASSTLVGFTSWGVHIQNMSWGELITATNSYYHLEGYMDEAMVFSRAMSEADINDLMAATGDYYRIWGNVTENDIPVDRVVRIYERATGKLIKSTTSPAGMFEAKWRYSQPDAKYFAIAFDDDDLPIFDPIAHDRLTPEIIT